MIFYRYKCRLCGDSFPALAAGQTLGEAHRNVDALLRDELPVGEQPLAVVFHHCRAKESGLADLVGIGESE